jgi:hypothetical protein
LRGRTAEYVAASDDDGDLYPKVARAPKLLRETVHDPRIDVVALSRVGEHLARKLEQYSLVPLPVGHYAPTL